jgi:hypothetical protein
VEHADALALLHVPLFLYEVAEQSPPLAVAAGSWQRLLH